ncbi:MAG TPA: hypothetical protein VI603_05910 [Saprospiraceae bacterium]|nr:hypothetical protein [Saprospiraceae bacterium]
MKIPYFITVCTLSFAVSLAYGQSYIEDDSPIYSHTVYRLDGSILKGEITEWNTEYIRLKLLSGIEITLPSEEVRKVISRNVPKPTVRTRGTVEKLYQFKDEGIYHVTTTAFSAGPYAGLGVTHTVGYRFSRLFGMGVGTGAESFDIGSGNQIVPLFAEARGFFMAQNISPYYAVRAGYGFSLKNTENNITKTRGGMTFGAELGYRFGATRAVNFFTGVGVHFQKATYWYEWPWEGRFTDEVKYRRTELKFGVIF